MSTIIHMQPANKIKCTNFTLHSLPELYSCLQGAMGKAQLWYFQVEDGNIFLIRSEGSKSVQLKDYGAILGARWVADTKVKVFLCDTRVLYLDSAFAGAVHVRQG